MSEGHGGRRALEGARHWVVKVGSNVLLREDGQLDRGTFVELVRQLEALCAQGTRITLVSSGAVALGRHVMGEGKGTRAIPRLQALAALGQARLMKLYEEEWSFYGRHVAQVLLTRGDLDDRQRYLNVRWALGELHQMGVVPIINENDTVSTEELKFGDNDQLAAMTCGVAGAAALV
ncbi:MAG: glutamate 5-kinase, partial [Myxococcota bacterium]